MRSAHRPLTEIPDRGLDRCTGAAANRVAPWERLSGIRTAAAHRGPRSHREVAAVSSGVRSGSAIISKILYSLIKPIDINRGFLPYCRWKETSSSRFANQCRPNAQWFRIDRSAASATPGTRWTNAREPIALADIVRWPPIHCPAPSTGISGYVCGNGLEKAPNGKLFNYSFRCRLDG